TSTPTGGFCQQVAKKNGPAQKISRVHFNRLDQVPDGETVMSGMFLANRFPAVVLFDSGASHTFISDAYVSRCGFEVSNLKQGYQIIAPGSLIDVNRVIWRLSLRIGGKDFLIDPLVLPHRGVDIIIGMNWMKEHRVVLDIQNRTIQLQPTPKDPVIIVQLPTNETLSWAVNATS